MKFKINLVNDLSCSWINDLDKRSNKKKFYNIFYHIFLKIIFFQLVFNSFNSLKPTLKV